MTTVLGFDENGLWPIWAIGRADSSIALGAQLCTKDGRRIGNACVVASVENSDSVSILTDAGTRLVLNATEVDELFHPAIWLMDPATCPGAMVRGDAA